MQRSHWPDSKLLFRHTAVLCLLSRQEPCDMYYFCYVVPVIIPAVTRVALWCCIYSCWGRETRADFQNCAWYRFLILHPVKLVRLTLCLCVCEPQMEVQAPPGTTVGYIKQDWHPCVPRFSIQGANKETVMKLEGPCFACNCCGDVNFEVGARTFQDWACLVTFTWFLFWNVPLLRLSIKDSSSSNYWCIILTGAREWFDIWESTLNLHQIETLVLWIAGLQYLNSSSFNISHHHCLI